MTSIPTPVPDGYKKDAQGRLIPISLVKDVDLLRDELVCEVVEKAKEQSEALTNFKSWVMAEIRAFVEISAERFGVTFGGKKGNIQLLSYDGRYKVLVAVADRLAFDERLQVAKELIDGCIRRWSEGAKPEILALIEDAFQVDRQNQVSTGRILGLRKLSIDDEQWLQAMQAITESIQTVSSKNYIRVYEREEATGEYRPIALDVAAVREA